MKTASKILIFTSACLVASPVLAQAIDGFVSPAFVFSSVSGSTRTRLELQFARLQKSVEIDLSLGQGGGYSDYGAVLRIFNHFPMASDSSATGVSLGLGLGAYSASAGLPRAYRDIVVSPFVRGIFDFGMGLGIALEAGMQLVPRQIFTDGAQPKSSSTLRKGFFAGATLLISSRWME